MLNAIVSIFYQIFVMDIVTTPFVANLIIIWAFPTLKMII